MLVGRLVDAAYLDRELPAAAKQELTASSPGCRTVNRS